ncbi:Bardet-Biedl syndrome 5 protein homolog isoform X2 [Hermetia illucens]|uniref:Bardet-Biedl syndrome 5 protein homolog isoform X2 n=1 Tax=Hermetia illucens TaxID=343691 RepID=UPI0018CBF360|nr:Bardet-Biedl syndrome 5 protein homolog isoform X2 [Hermetia illucens]
MCRQYNLRSGEKALDLIDYIEDTKGNPDDSGKLLVTNLRLIWYSLVHKKFNLSIGYQRILSLQTRTVYSKARRTHQALHVMGVGVNMRFEFLFTDMSMKTSKVSAFTSVFDVYRLYQDTLLYREVKLRGAIVQSGQLVILPQEQVYSNFQGVWNLSSDQGNLGSFIITNIRMVWFADVNESFNISLPYMHMSYIKIRESKYGPALVIQTSETGGGYVLGFRIDPPERLTRVYQELKSLYAIYSETPNFGIVYQPDKNPKLANEASEEESVESKIEQEDRQRNEKLNLYLAEGSTAGAKIREPFYCKELGFAMEKLRDGYKLSDLWNVIPFKEESSEDK